MQYNEVKIVSLFTNSAGITQHPCDQNKKESKDSDWECIISSQKLTKNGPTAK